MAKVKRVIDGDTFETISGQRVRLADVDAPEKGKPGSAKATEKLESLVGNKNVIVDPVGTSYGRIVADVEVDGQSVNKSMQRHLKGK